MKRFIISCMLALLLVSTGCGSLASKIVPVPSYYIPISSNDLRQIRNLKIVFHEIQDKNVTLRTLNKQIVRFIFFGGIAPNLIISSMEKSEGQSTIKECALPGYSQMVMNSFVDRVAKEISYWPQMEVIPPPLSDNIEPTLLEGDFVLSFRTNWIRFKDYGEDTGFSASLWVYLYNKKREFLWRQHYEYFPSSYKREGKWEELVSENCNLLIAEERFAAEKTATFLIDSLKKQVK
jgi:hypothetical protein